MSDKANANSPLRITKRTPGYWRVTFDNPPINLQDVDMIVGVQRFLDQLEADHAVKVVVFDSADEDYFISHYDLVRAGEVPMTPGPSGLPFPLHDIAVRLAQSHVISIASVRGRARGSGAEFIVACDMSFASREKAILGHWEVGASAVPGAGGIERLSALVGRSRALEIIIGCEDFDVDTAERYGWINRSLPDTELDRFVDTLATRISSFNQDAITTAKALTNKRTHGIPPGADLLEDLTEFSRLAALPDAQARIGFLLKQGLQQRSDVELHLGRYLADLGAQIS